MNSSKLQVAAKYLNLALNAVEPGTNAHHSIAKTKYEIEKNIERLQEQELIGVPFVSNIRSMANAESKEQFWTNYHTVREMLSEDASLKVRPIFQEKMYYTRWELGV